MNHQEFQYLKSQKNCILIKNTIGLLCIICKFYSFIFRLKYFNTENWAEDLLPPNLHGGINICYDCWFDEVPFL